MPLSPKDLEDRIAKARAARARHGPDRQGTTPDAESNRALGVGLRLGIEFVSALIVGGGLGWLVGRWLGAAPIGLLVGILLGFGAGLLSVRRAMNAAYDPVIGEKGEATDRLLATEMKDTEEDDAEPS